jgi:hypothetical protein
MGEEAVGAIFSDAKGKRKEDAAEGSSSRDPKKKKRKVGRGSNSVRRTPSSPR